jgi:hypothetical protein
MFRQSRNKDKYEDSLIFKMERWIKEAFKYGVEFAQQWTAVEEELPVEEDKYLTKQEYGIFLQSFNTYHNCWDDESGDDYYTDAVGGKVTHWRKIELT